MQIDFLLENVRLFGAPASGTLAIAGDRIVAGGDCSGATRVDAAGCLVVPALVDPHVHLDMALSNPDGQAGRAAPFRSPRELNALTEARRRSFTRDGIEARALRALELASANGVTAMRAQCHVDTEVGLRHLEGLLGAKARAEGWMDLQIVAFPQQGLASAQDRALAREALASGADLMGCAPNLDAGQGMHAHVDVALEIAGQAGVGIDAHLDLGIPADASLASLESVYLARRVLETGFAGSVTGGHLCTLDALPAAQADEAIGWLARAGMHVISQPDLYRLGREDDCHVRRGLTRVKSLLAAGVNVAFASNNVRDSYRPLGNFDPLEEALVLAYGAHMDSEAELEALLRMCTYNAARAMGLADYGLAPGCVADLVVLDAATPAQAVARQAVRKLVFRRGRLLWQETRTRLRCV